MVSSGEDDMTQLELLDDDLKPVDFNSPIGMYGELKDVKGVQELSEKGLEALHYLFMNHARPEDGFIPAKAFAHMLGFFDTRDVRKLMNEIDLKTDMVVYASQHGYKLASNENEIDEAIRFALAPALTTIKRVMAKSKNQSKARLMQGYIGNIEKLYGGHAQGQLTFDEEGIKEVDHYPNQPFTEYMPPVSERVKKYEEMKK